MSGKCHTPLNDRRLDTQPSGLCKLELCVSLFSRTHGISFLIRFTVTADQHAPALSYQLAYLAYVTLRTDICDLLKGWRLIATKFDVRCLRQAKQFYSTYSDPKWGTSMELYTDTFTTTPSIITTAFPWRDGKALAYSL
jgi:hypothetical protein